jgi:hypothetical protein
MANPRRMISRSLASTLTMESREARRQELRDHPRSLRRTSLLALHACVVQSAALTGSRHAQWDATFVSSGDEFSVFKTKDDEVIKIAHNTLLMSRAEQRRYAENRQREHKLMAHWLGGFVLPQTYSVEPLSFLPGRTVVQVRQSYREISDPCLFEPLNTNVLQENLANLQAIHPDSTSQLGDFLERSRALHESEDLVPDTNGGANLVLDGEELLMVDGQPIGTEHRPVQKIILGQLASLELAIAA